MSSATKRICRSHNKRGEPCSARAVTVEGFCAVHGGLVDPATIGRKGGKASKLTKLRRAVRQDDELREEARQVLARALRGEEVPKAALDSARSLFSYRSDVPPAGEQAARPTGPAKIIVLRDIVELAVQCGEVRAKGGVIEVAGRDGWERVEVPPGRENLAAHDSLDAFPHPRPKFTRPTSRNR
jgi:plasmid stability protein